MNSSIGLIFLHIAYNAKHNLKSFYILTQSLIFFPKTLLLLAKLYYQLILEIFKKFFYIYCTLLSYIEPTARGLT